MRKGKIGVNITARIAELRALVGISTKKRALPPLMPFNDDEFRAMNEQKEKVSAWK